MNSLGKILRMSIYGESHGIGIGVILDGVPQGLEVSVEDFKKDIARRKPEKLGTTKRIEEDIPELLSGIYEGKTTGAPINIFFKNKNKQSEDYLDFKNHPRPGHADFTSTFKYKSYNDIRGSGHFSGRMTLGLVAGGVIAKKILENLFGNIIYNTEIKKIGKLMYKDNNKEIEKEIEKIKQLGDSLGGVVQCEISNIPIGLGEPFFDSVESLISHGIFSIPGIKGIEFGSGFLGCENLGSEFNDCFINKDGKTLTNNNGGINGGISNGNKLIFSVGVKPTSSIIKKQETYNFKNDKIETLKIQGRHDVAFILRVPIVIEAITSMVLADLSLRMIK
ncbi:MAG: chorismate synthase [Fusobacteriaceae bacterium]